MTITGVSVRFATAVAIFMFSLQGNIFSLHGNIAFAQQAGVPDPQGVQVGGFQFYPQLKVTTYYDDNVFLSTTDPRTDVVELFTPSVLLRSNWSTNELQIDGTSTVRRFDKNSEQDTTEYEGGANGELDFTASIPISGSIRAGHRAEVLGTPGGEDIFGRYRLYDFVSATAGINKEFNRLIIGASGSLMDYRYDPLHVAGVTYDQSSSDRDVRTLSGQIQYQYSSITVPFISVLYNTIKYVHPGDVPPQDSTGTSILIGTSFEFTRLFYGKFALGYEKQVFKNPAYSAFSGLNFQADLTYKPTRFDMLHFTATRSIVNSAIIGVPGVQQSDFSLEEVHELTPKMSIDANLIYDREIYRGINRNQNRYTGFIALRRTLNRYLSASLAYQRLDQRADGAIVGGPAADYSGNRVSLSLIASL